MNEDEAAPKYRFGPLERRGLVAGWRGGQIAAVATALVVAVGILRARPSLAGAAVAFVAVAAGVMVATWPVAGRTAEQWAPDAVRHVGTLLRQKKLTGRQPFAALRFLDIDLTGTGTGAGAGVIHDLVDHTYTAVLKVSGPGFVLLGATDKSRRVGGWSGVLASLAREGTAVHRIQWIERSVPDNGSEVRRHLAATAVLDGDSRPRRSYADLVEDEVSAVHRHEVMVALTVHAGHSARAVRAAGGGQRGACAVLLRESASLARRMGEAGLDVAGILDRRGLADCIRGGFDTDAEARAVMTSANDVTERSRSIPSPWPGPMGLVAEWGRVRTDATWHSTYWIAEWPRTEVAADFLGPLLLVSDIRRSVSVVMEPVAPAGRPPDRTGPDGRHRRCRATPPGWLSGHGPASTRGGRPRPARGRIGRRSRFVPVLGLSHRERVGHRSPGGGVWTDGAGGGTGRPRVATLLRGSGRRLHLHSALRSRPRVTDKRVSHSSDPAGAVKVASKPVVSREPVQDASSTWIFAVCHRSDVVPGTVRVALQ